MVAVRMLPHVECRIPNAGVMTTGITHSTLEFLVKTNCIPNFLQQRRSLTVSAWFVRLTKSEYPSMLPSKWKMSDVSWFRHLLTDWPYCNLGTRPVRSLSKVMRVFDLLYSYDRLTSIFMYPRNKKNSFSSVVRKQLWRFGRSWGTGMSQKVLSRTCPKSFIYSDYGNLYIFEELYKNEL